jgi:hypothetical protein
LLDSGAAIDGVDGDGVPLAYAMHFGFVEVAELLGRRGATTTSANPTAAVRSSRRQR